MKRKQCIIYYEDILMKIIRKGERKPKQEKDENGWNVLKPCKMCSELQRTGELCVKCDQKTNGTLNREKTEMRELSKWLDRTNWLWCGINNGLKSNPRTVRVAKSMGLKLGAPDILIRPGFYALASAWNPCHTACE